jgi:hypothetical protein
VKDRTRMYNFIIIILLVLLFYIDKIVSFDNHDSLLLALKVSFVIGIIWFDVMAVKSKKLTNEVPVNENE